MPRTRYAIVGLGGRSAMFSHALLKDYKDHGELVGLCDVNQTRMDHYNRTFAEKFGSAPIPTYKAEDFDRMVRERKVDCVIVTSVDRTHHRYIIRAMELGCDAITEKPMTVDAEKCQAILDTVERTGKKLRVTFNYRYAPAHSRLRELIKDGTIGDVKSVHFEYLLDTRHGADYFRRWHRDKRNSGGLMVHKATHHFDLVNWWIDSSPKLVFGMGDLTFYGRENAEQRGVTRFYDRGTGHPNAKGCKFALDMSEKGQLRSLYLDAEHEDGYRRDQSVFSDGISIEDDMTVAVRYRSGATMSYHLTAYSPWEGLRIAFNGTKGRIEYDSVHSGYISGDDADQNRPDVRDAEEYRIEDRERILVRPLWSKPLKVEVKQESGGHGGGDVRLLDDVFVGGKHDPLARAADHLQGAQSILTGIAANLSFARGAPVDVDTIVRLPDAARRPRLSDAPNTAASATAPAMEREAALV